MATEPSPHALPPGHRPPLSMAEAAEYLNVTERWVKRAKEEGRLPFVRIGRYVRIQVADLDQLLAAGRIEVASPRGTATRSGMRRAEVALPGCALTREPRLSRSLSQAPTSNVVATHFDHGKSEP